MCEITAMQGSIYVAYNKPNLGSRSGVLGDLYLKDDASNKFRSNPLPRHVRQAFSMPVEQFGAISYADQIVRFVHAPDFVQGYSLRFQSYEVKSQFDRTCDICRTLILYHYGWHCNTCDDFDMCQTCYTHTENATLELPPPHQSDHPMSVFDSPDPTANGVIIWMSDDGGYKRCWVYVVDEDPNVRGFATFDLVC